MFAIVLAASLAAQATSVFSNARLDARPGADLIATLRPLLRAEPQPAWIGYAVPTMSSGQMCCFDSVDKGEASGWCCGGCRLEGGKLRHGTFTPAHGNAAAIPLEGAKRMNVLLRIEHGRISRLSAYSAGCALDAGGLPVHWLDDVAPAQSVALLAGLVSMPTSLPVDPGFESEHTLMALAHHDEPSVDAVLEQKAGSGEIESRKQAVFWLGEARGRKGYEALLRILQRDKSEELREHAVFALSQSEVPEAVAAMIRVAKEDASTEVRGKALFWLSQKAGRQAAAAITDAVRDDPEADVKEKAVFALSQLPPDQGIPELIHVAQTNHNPGVREKAFFWLGQSEDPRALDFITHVLTK
jgi:HEAT repeat protein